MCFVYWMNEVWIENRLNCVEIRSHCEVCWKNEANESHICTQLKYKLNSHTHTRAHEHWENVADKNEAKSNQKKWITHELSGNDKIKRKGRNLCCFQRIHLRVAAFYIWRQCCNIKLPIHTRISSTMGLKNVVLCVCFFFLSQDFRRKTANLCGVRVLIWIQPRPTVFHSTDDRVHRIFMMCPLTIPFQC